tara:strand:- start:224 stop:469 length:246 start_codon:yes stop_codon:yes gene_type:complete
MKNAKDKFIEECAMYIKGELSEIKIKGQKDVVQLFANVIAESRKFYTALQEDDLKKVMPVLERKKRASQVLRQKTGYVWPL